MTSNPYPQLALLYSRLLNWTSISDFETALGEYFRGKRSNAEIADYRARRGHLKKLRDEVIPVLQYVSLARLHGEIRFQLGNDIPDCWVRENLASEQQGVEITVAQAREQQLLGDELNKKRIGRGFLGLHDEASSQAFRARLERPRVMFSTEQALKVVSGGIVRCLNKKNKPKYRGLDLVIEAPLILLPNERWAAIEDELRLAAMPMPFQKIYVVDNRETSKARPFGFQIK